MKQWLAEIAYDTTSGTRRRVETFYVPTIKDVREAVHKRGAYVLWVREHERSPMERIFARSSWWQIQLLRGIHFRATHTSPGVAFWNLIESETNPMRQNILAPAREALSQGLGVMDALKALRIFDHGTLAILAASERANRLAEGIPHAIESIAQKKKNIRAVGGTLAWLGFDIFTITQAMFWGKDVVLGWFRDNAPSDPAELEKYNYVVGNLELIWNALIVSAMAAGGLLIWCILSFIYNRGKADFPTARLVRKIPLIGAYLRDLGFADSMSAAARMLRGTVPIGEAMRMASEATNVPEVTKYWMACYTDLQRGVSLGSALDREPLTRNERMELASLSDLKQVATVLESIAEMRVNMSRTKHSLIVWLAFGLTGVYLLIAFGSAIYALTVMNMSMDSMLGGLLGGAL